MESFDSLVEEENENIETLQRYDLDTSWHWLHEVFRHQPHPLDKTISGDCIPKALEGNTIERFGRVPVEYDYYCGLASPQLVIEIAQELSFVTESIWQSWCLKQQITDAWYEDFETVQYAYTEAAAQQKPLLILIV